MSAFDDVVAGIEARMNQEYNCIPTDFERLSPYYPGIERKTMYMATASSGVGKSKLTRKMAIYQPLEWLAKHPECPIKYKLFYFSLEETKEQFIWNGILTRLAEVDGIELDTQILKQVGVRRKLLTPAVLEKIKGHKVYFDELLTRITFIDHIKNPTGIYYEVMKYARAHGKMYFIDPEKGTKTFLPDPVGKTWNHYEPDDPNEIVLGICDHVSLLTPEKDKESGRVMTLTETIDKFSNHYCIDIRNKLGYSWWNVQQQAADKERVETNFRGQTIEAKLEPSLDGLGDSKKTQRDADYVFGLFAPARYDIPEHRGYDIKLLGDSYRMLSVLKARSVPAGARISLHFQGAINEFAELPPVEHFKIGLASYQDYIPKQLQPVV